MLLILIRKYREKHYVIIFDIKSKLCPYMGVDGGTVLTTEEVAEVLDRHPQTLRNWRRSISTISPPFTKIGGRYFYPIEGLAEYVEKVSLADDGIDYIAHKLGREK